MILKRITSLIVGVALISQQVFAAAGTDVIKEHKRTKDTITDITKSSKPSDLATVGVSDFFQREAVNLISNMDISKHIGKKIFVGYGLADVNEKNCKFIEQPGVTRADYDAVLSISSKHNGHIYALTKDKMSYQGCKTLAKKLGGNPVIVSSDSESGFVASTFTNKKINGNTLGNAWTGIYRESCQDKDFYKSTDDRKQDYFNWGKKNKPMCQNGQKHIMIDSFGNFVAATGNETAACLIEFDSDDYYKPVKICASWWKIIRDYDGIKQTLYDVNMLNRINQADVPISLAICTHYDQAEAQKHNANKSSRRAQCTEYYSRTIAEECYENPRQPICFVSECNGYIKNACRPVKSDTVGKEYVKGEILIDGKIREQGTKVDIVTKEFDCPPSPIANTFCTESAQVIVYPKECPGSQCDALKQCVYESGSDNTKWEQCFKQFKCTKIYGGRDIPPRISPTGEVQKLFGKCPDGQVLEFDVNIQEKVDRKCLKYEVITKKEKGVEKCSEERGYTDHVVNLAITDKDIYQDNPKCIRLDEVAESQIKQTMAVRITPMGFFQSKVTQENLDGTTQVIGSDIGSYSYVVKAALQSKPLEIAVKPKYPAEKEQKKRFNDGVCGPMNSLIGSLSGLFLDLPNDQESSLPGNARIQGQRLLFDLPETVPDPPKWVLDNEEELKKFRERWGRLPCEGSGADILSQNQLGNSVSGSSCDLRYRTWTFYINLPSFVRDASVFDGGSLRFTNTLATDKKSCADYGICLGGGYSFSGGKCINWNGDADAQNDALEEFYPSEDTITNTSTGIPDITARDVIPRPMTPVSIPTLLQNGLQSAIFIEEYIRGGWGWYSNYNTYPAKINLTEIKHGAGTLKQVSGNEKKMTKITDLLNYKVDIHHWWKRAKKPSTAVVIASGAVATASYYIGSAWTFAAVNILGYLILVLFTKPRKFDSQETWYRLWKGIPHKFYDPGKYETRYDHEKPGEPEFVDKWYGHLHLMMPDRKPGDAKKFVKNVHTALKYLMLENVGIPRQEVPDHPWELGNWGSNYPKCKRWKPFCTKTNDGWAGYHTPNSHIPNELTGFEEGDDNIRVGQKVMVRVPLEDVTGYGAINKIRKEMSNLYIGGVNTLMVVVPYKGNYTVVARDRLNRDLAVFKVHKDMFVTKKNTLFPSAQVLFGNTMDIRYGVDTPCRSDRAVEWGGGVTGTFWETQRTAENLDCSHANDKNVFKNSMMWIEVIPDNMDRGFLHKLELPMPFANRVWLVSLDMDEERRYRCFKDFTGCEEEQYVEVTDGR